MEAGNILGIDIGTSTIKVLVGNVQEQSISITGSGLMQTAGFTKGEVADWRLLAVSIRQAVDCAIVAAEVPLEHAYLGIGGMGVQFASTVRGSIAPASRREITRSDVEMVKRAVVVAHVSDEYRVLHFSPECYYVDGIETSTPLLCRGERLEVSAHIVTVPKIVVSELTAAVEKTGIGVAGIVANAVVGGQVMASHISQQNSLMIDMGAGVTDISLVRNQCMVPLISLPLGGEYITSDLMQGLAVNKNHAEAIKRYYSKLDKSLLGTHSVLDCNDYGTTDKNVPYDFLYNIIESRVEEIISMIFSSIQPYLDGTETTEILLTGGCAAMLTIREWLEKIFQMPVRVIVPQQLPPEYAYPANTAGYGILLYAAQCRPEIKEEGPRNWRSFFGRIKSRICG